MTVLSLKPNRNILLIGVIALVMFTGGLLMLHAVPLAAKNKVANGLLADLVVTFPVLYYFIVIRPLKRSAKKLLLVISICSALAYLILPDQQRGYILQLRKLTALAELLFVIYAITKFNKLRLAYKIQRATLPDPVYNLRAAIAHIMGESLAVKVMASELAVLRYGLFGWRSERNTLTQSRAFSTHKEFGYIAIWSVLVFAVMVEVVAFHLLLLKWSHTAALIVTALSLYSIILMVADLCAVIQRKVEVNNDKLLLRTGMRWRVYTDMNNILSIKKITGDHATNDVYFKGGITKNSGNMLITFRQPVQVDKLYGASKQHTAILMHIDDFEGLVKIIGVDQTGRAK